jgi:type I restriction enzyme, S subunit
MIGFDNKKLGEVLTFQRGFDITKSEQQEGKIPIVSSSGIKSFHNKAKRKGPGVIIGRKGTLGTVHYVSEDYWPHDTSLWIKDFKGNDPRFLYYFQTLHLENFDTGSSNPTLNRNHIHKIDIIFPEHKIQRKIAATLTAYDDLIENNKRRIEKLEYLAKEIYTEWFVRFRFPSYENTKFEKGIPEGWNIVKIKDIYKTSSGGTPSRNDDRNFNGSVIWIKTGELKSSIVLDSDEKISDIGLQSSAAKVYPQKTIVMAMYCAMPDMSILGVEAATNQACCAFLPKRKYLNFPFNYHFLKNSQVHMIAFAHGAAQQNLSQALIQGFNILLPDERTIDLFGKVTVPIYDQIETLMRANIKLERTRDLLLPRLISGKLSVADLDITFPPSMKEEENS